MVTGINDRYQQKILTKDILCKSKGKFDGSQCKSNQKWNNNKCRCEWKFPEKHNALEKYYIWNLAKCSCENGEYLAIAIDNSLITCNEITNTTNTNTDNASIIVSRNVTGTMPTYTA